MKSFFSSDTDGAALEDGVSVQAPKKSLREYFDRGIFLRSFRELGSVRNLCVISMLIALDIVIKLTINIQVNEFIKLSFAFVALSAVGMLYGPTVGFLAGLITDILGFIIKPTGAFDIRFTLIEAVGGLIYGLFLYNAVSGRWFVPRIVAAKATVVAVCNLWLTTWALSSVMGRGFTAMLPARVASNLIQLPVDIVILAVFLPLILLAYNRAFKNVRKVPENTLFSDKGFIGALTYLICLILVIICCLGFSSQDLKTKNSELQKTVAAQSEQLELMQQQLDYVYEQEGIEKPQPPAEDSE